MIQLDLKFSLVLLVGLLNSSEFLLVVERLCDQGVPIRVVYKTILSVRKMIGNRRKFINKIPMVGKLKSL